MNLTGRANRFFIRCIKALPFGRVRAFDAYSSLVQAIFHYDRALTWYGSELICDPGDSLQSRILYFGVWEPNITELIKLRLRPGDTFVDIGANIGYDTLMASSLVGALGCVVSIEASPMIFRRLTENVSRNAAANVRTLNVAASDKPGVLEIFAGDPGNLGSTTTIRREHSIFEAQVEAMALDVLLTPREMATCRVIKMDIEGGELPVLRRIAETIDVYPTTMELIVEITPTDEDQELWSEVLGKFSAAGFHFYLVENDYHQRFYIDWREMSRLTELTSFPDSKLFDVFFTRDPSFLALA